MADDPTVVVVTSDPGDDPSVEPVVIDHEGRIASVETRLDQVAVTVNETNDRVSAMTEAIENLDDRVGTAVSLALEAIVVAEPEPTPDPKPEPEPDSEPLPKPEPDEPPPPPDEAPASKVHRWWRK